MRGTTCWGGRGSAGPPHLQHVGVTFRERATKEKRPTGFAQVPVRRSGKSDSLAIRPGAQRKDRFRYDERYSTPR